MHHGKHGAGQLRADSLLLFVHVANGEVATASSRFHFISNILERRGRKSKKQLRMLGKCNLKADACKALVLSERTRQKLVLQSNQAGLHLR